MPVLADFNSITGEHSSINMSLNSPTSVSGWTIRYRETKYFGGSSGFAEAHVASGFNAVSGIEVTNGPLGHLTITLRAGDTSGRVGSYPYRIERLDSGFQSVLTEGYRVIGQ